VYPDAVEAVPGIRAARVGPALRFLAAAAVVIASVWLPAALPARASAADSPLVLAPGVGLFDQFGYVPAYTRNVPAFDEDGRSYIRSRTSSGAATSYVHTRVAGSWLRLDFLAALRAAYPSFVRTVGAGGLRSDGLVFDRQGRAYNPVTLEVRDGSTRNALLVSWDHCRTWKVFKLPPGTFTTERRVGHNELDGPPFLAVWRTSAPPDLPGSQTNTLYVTQPRLEGDRLVLPPLVSVTERCLGLSRDSGGASFAVTRGGTTWFVWSETAPNGGGGTPHYVSTYDHATGTAGGRLRLATSPERSDPHDKPGICLDSAGYLHVIAGGHGSPALYARSLAPLNAAGGWTAPMPVLSTGWASTTDPAAQQGRQTYPAFVCDRRDTLHLVTRQWRRGVDPYHDGSGYAALVHQSCASGDVWGEPSVVVAAADPGYGVFFHKLALDARDRLFLSCSYQGGPELREERVLRASLAVLGRSQLRPGKYRSRMLLVSGDGGVSWRFAADADLDPPDEAGGRAAAASGAAAGPWSGHAAAEPPATTWRWLNPLPQGNQFTGLAFPTERSGWAVGTHGTVHRTTDGGRHWTAQAVPTAADLFGVAAADADRAWAVGAAGTVLRTTDGGTTWLPLYSGTTRDLFGVCAVSGRDVWAVGELGTILHSVDAGRTWTVSRASSEPLFGVAFADRRHGLVCGGRGMLLRTRDGGRGWHRRRSLSAGSLFSLALLKDGRAVAAGEGGVILRSADRGWTWQRTRTATNDTLRAVLLLASGRVWASGEHRVLRSSDGGRRWTTSRLPVPGPCGALATAGGRLVFAGGAGGALCRSADGGRTWRPMGSGPLPGWTDALAAGGEVWVAGAGGALLRADAAGASRIWHTVADGADLGGVARAGARGWVVGDGGTIAGSTDGGATWATLPSPTAEDLEDVAAPASQTLVVAGRAGTLLTSTDAGVTWRSSGVTADDLLCLTFVDGAHGWAGGGATFGETRAAVYRTLDGGLTWDEADLPTWGRVRDLCFIDQQTGWAAVEDWGIDGDRPEGAILATADGGETWVSQATTAPGLLAVSIGPDGAGWACGERGLVLQTADWGLTWTARDAGTDSALPAAVVTGPGEVWLAGADGAVISGGQAPQ
jgi:photosystem II stability/assembly factor-like uncharacterized protein